MEGRSRCLIFDPFAGISGDMILGALLDLGLPVEWLKELVAGLPISAEIRVTAVSRGALTATAVSVVANEPERERRLSDVLEVIEAAGLDSEAAELGASAFRRLAEVEAALHGTTPEKVHFHEVGAVDALVDIIGTAAGVRALDVAECFTRPVALGSGWVTAAHGRLPLPAPATLKLLEGLPVFEADFQGELTTPTGAVLLAVLTGGRRAPGEFVPLRSGFGAGSRNPATHPNCLRVVLAESVWRGAMYVVQADLDDMSPEYLPPLLEALYEAGAADVWTQTVQMKKGRTGVRMEALVSDADRHKVGEALFRESTTIGIRYWRVDREVLPRETHTIEWRGFPIRVKTSTLHDGHVRRKPEYEDVVRAARESGIAPLEAWREIERQLDSGGAG